MGVDAAKLAEILNDHPSNNESTLVFHNMEELGRRVSALLGKRDKKQQKLRAAAQQQMKITLGTDCGDCETPPTVAPNRLYLYLTLMEDSHFDYSADNDYNKRMIEQETVETRSVRFLVIATRNPHLHHTPALSLNSLVHCQHLVTKYKTNSWPKDTTTDMRIRFVLLGSVTVQDEKQWNMLQLLQDWLLTLRDEQSKLWLPKQFSPQRLLSYNYYVLPLFDHPKSIHLSAFMQSKEWHTAPMHFSLLIDLLNLPLDVERLIKSNMAPDATRLDQYFQYLRGSAVLANECKRANVDMDKFAQELEETDYRTEFDFYLDEKPHLSVMLNELEKVASVMASNLVLYQSKVYMIMDVDFSSSDSVMFVCVPVDTQYLQTGRSLYEIKKNLKHNYTRKRCALILSSLPSMDEHRVGPKVPPPRETTCTFIAPTQCTFTRLKYEPASILSMIDHIAFYLNELYEKQMNLAQFQESELHYHFNDPRILQQCFMHKTFTTDFYGSEHDSNEMLEFLGDGILELLAGHMYFEANRTMNGNDLHQCTSQLVRNNSLLELASQLNLRTILLKTRMMPTAKQEAKVDPDTVEALIAAIFMDQGMDGVLEFWMKFFPPWLPDSEMHSFAEQRVLPAWEYDRLIEAQHRLNIKFNNPFILAEALSCNDAGNSGRLLHLGTFVLKFVVANHLYANYQGSYEKQMSDMSVELTNTKQMAAATKTMELDRLYQPSLNDNQCANLFNALIGALYLDQGGLHLVHGGRRAYDVKSSQIHMYLLESKNFTVHGKNELDELLIHELECPASILKMGNGQASVTTNSVLIAKGYGATKKEILFDAMERAWQVAQIVRKYRHDKDLIDLANRASMSIQKLQQMAVDVHHGFLEQKKRDIAADLLELDRQYPRLRNYRLNNGRLDMGKIKFMTSE